MSWIAGMQPKGLKKSEKKVSNGLIFVQGVDL